MTEHEDTKRGKILLKWMVYQYFSNCDRNTTEEGTPHNQHIVGDCLYFLSHGGLNTKYISSVY